MKKVKTLILTMVLILTGGVLLACCDKSVTITSKELDTSSVDTHVSYFDQLDYSGVTGEIKYSDDSTVALTSENVTASAVDYTKAGEQSVVFTYENVELKKITVEVETFEFYVDSSGIGTVQTGSAVDFSALKVWYLDEEEGYVQLQDIGNDFDGYEIEEPEGFNSKEAEEGIYDIKVSYVYRGKTLSQKFKLIVSDKMNTNLHDENGYQILFNVKTYTLTGEGIEDLQLFKGDQAASTDFIKLENGVYKLKITENGIFTLKYKKDGVDTQRTFHVVEYLKNFGYGGDWTKRQGVLQDIENGTSTSETDTPKLVDFHEKADYVVGSGNDFYFDLEMTSDSGAVLVADDELLEYKLQVKVGNEYQETDIETYATVNGEKFRFNADAVGKEFKMSITPKYNTEYPGVEFEFKVEDGVNVFTHDELVKNFADLRVNKIILQREITTVLKAEQYNVLINSEADGNKLVTEFTEEERFVSNYNIGMGSQVKVSSSDTDTLKKALATKEVVTAQERLDALKKGWYLVFDQEGNLIHNFTSSPYVRFAYNQKDNNIEVNGNLFTVNAWKTVPLLDPVKVKAFDEKKYFGSYYDDNGKEIPYNEQGKLLSISSTDGKTFAYNCQTAMFDFGLYGGTSSQRTTNLNAAAQDVRNTLGTDNSGDLSDLPENSLAIRKNFDETERVKAIFKNINLVGNSSVSSGDLTDPDKQQDASLKSGGLNLIKYKNDVDVTNSSFYYGRIGFFAAGSSTDDLDIDKTTINNMWSDAIYVYQGGLVKLRNSILGASGAPAIWIEDNYVTNGDVFDPYLDLNSSVTIDNYVVGTEPWFSTIDAGGSLVADVKTTMDTMVKSLSGNKKTILEDKGENDEYQTFNMAIGYWSKYKIEDTKNPTEFGQTRQAPKYLMRYKYNDTEIIRYYDMTGKDHRKVDSGFAAVVDEHASSDGFNDYIKEQATLANKVLQQQQDASELDKEENELAKIVYHALAVKTDKMQQDQLSDVEKVAFNNLTTLDETGLGTAAVKASMYLSFNAEDKGFVEFVVDIGDFSSGFMDGNVLIMTGFEPISSN